MSSVGSSVWISESREPAFQQGRLADVRFFLRQIAQGVPNGNFSISHFDPLNQLLLIKRCCLALLGQALSLWPRRCGDRFLVMKVEGVAVAAMLVRTIRDGADGHIVGIDYLVVDEEWRRRGIGTLFVQKAIDDAPAGSGFVCFCAPRSKAMMRLLLRFGFSRRVRAGLVDGNIYPHAFELVMESAGACASPVSTSLPRL